MRKKRKSKFLAIIISLAVALVMLPMLAEESWAEVVSIDFEYFVSHSVDGNLKRTGSIKYELDDSNMTATVISIQCDNYNNYAILELSIPSTVTHNGNEYTVTKIGNGDYVMSCYVEGDVIIPASVTCISDHAFARNSSFYPNRYIFEEGSKLEDIGEEAFYGNDELKEMTLPKNIKTIGERAFVRCNMLEIIRIPSDVTSIGKDAFRTTYYLKTIDLYCGTKQKWDRLNENVDLGYPEDCEVIFSGWNKDPDNITWIEDDTKQPGDKDYFKQSSVAKWTCTNGDSHVWESEALSMQVKSYQEPSCTQEGKCVYEAIFEAPDGENYLALKEVPIPATGHVLTKTEKVEPTCTESGYEEYWTCSTCKKMFSDKDGEHEIAEPVVIDATGHKWGEWNVTKEATYDKEGEETRICEHDATHTETRSIDKLDPVNADITYKNTKGDGSSWTKNSEEILEFAFERSENDKQTYERFKGILVDNEEVPEENEGGTVNYEKEAGSVIIKLQPEYLETLALGKHTLTAQFDDGSVTVDFTVLAAEDKKDDEEPEKDTNDDNTTSKDNKTNKDSGDDLTDDDTASKNRKTNKDSGNDLTKKNKTSQGDKNKTAGTTQAIETGDENGFLNWLMVFAASAGILISGWVMYKGRRKHIRKY